MRRITLKGADYVNYYKENVSKEGILGKGIWYDGADKLQKIEDLEEEIGFPLAKALSLIKDSNSSNSNPCGIYYEYNGELLFVDALRLFYDLDRWCFVGPARNLKEKQDIDAIYRSICVPLKAYKKLWWLKESKEE